MKKYEVNLIWQIFYLQKQESKSIRYIHIYFIPISSFSILIQLERKRICLSLSLVSYIYQLLIYNITQINQILNIIGNIFSINRQYYQTESLQIQILMKKQMLSFSSGCVINLDQIDDFPDYYDVITNLTEQIKQNNVATKTIMDFLDADLEDVQHIPQFKQLMDLLIANYEQVLQNMAKNKQQMSKMLKGKFIIFLLKIIKNYFTSFSIEQEEATPLILILKKQIGSYPQYFCDFLLAIATFAPYVEKHEELVDFYFAVINEKKFFSSQELAISYIKSIDKILRFRAFRTAFINRLNKTNGKQNKGFEYLSFKLSLHQNKKQLQLVKQAYLNFSKQVPENNSSQFLSNYKKKWATELAA